MSTAIAGKKLSTKRAEWDVRQRARQLKAHPDCRSTTIKLTRHENIPCVIVGARQSSSRRDRRNGHPACRCVPIQIDALHHGGTSVAGSFIQTLTMVDVATGWTECMPLVTRESGLVVRAREGAQSLFPWLIG